MWGIQHPLSPLLFNLYSEIFQGAPYGKPQSIILNGCCEQFADNTVTWLAGIFKLCHRKKHRNGSQIKNPKNKMANAKQTKKCNWLNQIRWEEHTTCIHLQKPLGCTLNKNRDNLQEIRFRIEQARAAFMKMKTVLCSQDINILLRIRILHYYVFSIFLYGVES